MTTLLLIAGAVIFILGPVRWAIEARLSYWLDDWRIERAIRRNRRRGLRG